MLAEAQVLADTAGQEVLRALARRGPSCGLDVRGDHVLQGAPQVHIEAGDGLLAALHTSEELSRLPVCGLQRLLHGSVLRRAVAEEALVVLLRAAQLGLLGPDLLVPGLQPPSAESKVVLDAHQGTTLSAVHGRERLAHLLQLHL